MMVISGTDLEEWPQEGFTFEEAMGVVETTALSSALESDFVLCPTK